MNRPYEALVILKPSGTEAEAAQSVKQVEDPIRKLGGEIRQSANWGRRRLAFPISHQQEGVYHLLQFQMAPNRLDELKRLFRLNETVVRFLVLSQEAQREGHDNASSRAPAAEPVAQPAGADAERTTRGGSRG